MTTLRLLAIVATMALIAVQSSCGNSGSGSGAKSGDCIEPDPRPDPPRQTIRETYMTMKCHLLCIEKVSSNQSATIEVSMEYPAWPTVPDSYLERNCSVYQKVQECRRGCLGEELCSRQCNSGCKASCNGNSNCNTVCQYNCDQDMCLLGCEAFKELEQIKNKTASPISPTGPMELMIPQDSNVAGLYEMNPTNAVPVISNATNTQRPITGFVIIIFSEESNDAFAFWMASFEDLLNLGAWACEDGLSLSLVAFNKYGKTSAAKSAFIINVYGEKPPTAPTNPKLYISIKRDNRPGYWKHAIIEIKWEKPRKGGELLAGYNGTFQLLNTEYQPNCEPKSQNFTLDKGQTSLLLHADSPLTGPVSDCKYTLQIKSVSITDMTAPPSPIHIIHVNSSITLPIPLSFKCSQMWNEIKGVFNYKTTWTVPNDTEVQQAIGSFTIALDLVKEENSEIKTINESVIIHTQREHGVTSYSYSYEAAFDNRPGHYHRITMTSQVGDPSRRVLIPVPRSRTFPAKAISPARVENVRIGKTDFGKVDSLSSTVEVKLEAEWNPASLGFEVYEVRLVTEETFNDTTSGILFIPKTRTARRKVNIVTSLPLPLQGPCIYFQVRANSSYGVAGNWSHPICIAVPAHVISPPFTFKSSSIPAATPSIEEVQADGEGTASPVMYIVIAIVLMLIISISILSLSVCIAFIQMQKNSKKTIRRRTTKVFMSRNVINKDKFPAVKLDKWEVYINQVSIQEQLGEGNFGEVYMGYFNSTISEKSEIKKLDANNSIIVAVKRLRDNASDRDRQIFLKHILQAKKVAQYPSPHVLSLVGCITEQELLSLLTEYPAQGNLLNYLRAERQKILQAQLHLLDYPDSVSGHALPVVMPQNSSQDGLQAADLMLFISHVAAGLDHLASIGVVHGDVACRNLFLTADKIVKIADFGLDSKFDEEKDLIYENTESGRLPVRWMAIESIRDAQFSTASDVWAFGVTLWEIVTLGGFPYHDTANSDILATLSAGQRLECPSNCSEEIYGILLKCCAAMPIDRPSFSTLHHVFKSLHTTAGNGQYVTLSIDRTKSYYLASPRSSTTESQTDEYALLMESIATDPSDDVLLTIPHGSKSYYVSHPPPVVAAQHARSASYNSYTHSDSGFLPCIEEEGEDDSDNEHTGEERAMEKEGEEKEEVEADSGNDSTLSRESLKLRKDSASSQESLKQCKEDEGEELEEVVVVCGTADVLGLI